MGHRSRKKTGSGGGRATGPKVRGKRAHVGGRGGARAVVGKGSERVMEKGRGGVGREVERSNGRYQEDRV